MSGHKPVPTGILEQPITTVERFARKFNIMDSGCWEWQAGTNKNGYGVFYVASKVKTAHRIMWELVGRQVDFDLELDHTCRNCVCVNPDHLEQVTSEENQRRRRGAYCKRGHPWANNEVMYNQGGGHMTRRCKACANIRGVNFYNKRKEAATLWNSASMTSSATD